MWQREKMAMPTVRGAGWCALPILLIGVGTFMTLGCQNTPVSLSEGPAPLRIPPPDVEACSYEDSLTGGQVFSMYCGACHTARSLAERPFANYKNAAAHMRVRANLTGKEYAKLMEWMRRWHDVPPPNPPLEPSAKRLTFSQPISELRPQTPAKDAGPGLQPGGAKGEAERQP